MNKLKFSILLAVLFMSLSILPSCNDETIDIPSYTVEGQDVSLSIPIKIPVREVK